MNYLLTSTSTAYKGLHTVNVTVGLNGQTIVQTFDIDLLDPCLIAIANLNGPPQGPIDYSVGSGPLSVPLTIFSNDQADCYGVQVCNANFSLGANPFGITLVVVGNAIEMVIDVTDISLLGTSAPLDVTYTVTGSGSNVPYQYTLNFVDPCPNTSMTFTPPLVPMTQEVYAVSSTQSLGAYLPTNTAAVDAGDPALCGPYKYGLMVQYPFVSIDLSTGAITVDSTDMADIGVYNVTITCNLAGYIGIVPGRKFNVTVEIIDPCLATVLTLPTVLSTFTITYGDGIGFS